MRKFPVNDLNALSASMLGFMGLGLLLIPMQLQTLLSGQPAWLANVLGILCFLTALLSLMSFSIRLREKWELLTRVSCILLQLTLGVEFIHGRLFIEGFLFVFMGLAQAFNLLPINNEFKDGVIFRGVASILNAVGGISLLSFRVFPEHPYHTLYPYADLLALIFFLSAAVGALLLFKPLQQISGQLSRLMALPWLIWVLIFLSEPSLSHLMGPTLVAIALLFADFFPWENLSLPDSDILGKRVVLTGSALIVLALAFASAALNIADNSPSHDPSMIASMRAGTFLFFCLLTSVLGYGISTILMTINGLIAELNKSGNDLTDQDMSGKLIAWNQRLAPFLKPFALSRDGLNVRMIAQMDQIDALSRQLSFEKQRNLQLQLLSELSQQLENQLDKPVSAQLTVNMLEQAIPCSLVRLYLHEPERGEFMALAAAGEQTSAIPPGFRQNASIGALGRAMRQRKTQIIPDIRSDADYIPFPSEDNLSAIVVPIIFNGHVNAAIVINSKSGNAFSSADVALTESAATELTRAWERSGYHQRLTELIQSGSALSTLVEPSATAREVSAVAKQIFQARFAYVQIQLGQEGDFTQSASAGDAPRLLVSLEFRGLGDALVHAAFHASEPFRVRDVRKYSPTSHLEIDHNSLRSMLAIPIRWHRLSIGIILVFGKQNEIFFTENDESLAELLSIQAAGAFESTWLQQELRASLRTTSLLYRLSNQVVQAEDLHGAAMDIAQTAHKLAKGLNTGIVLFTSDGKIDAQVELDDDGPRSDNNHPMEMIRQVMNTGQLMYLAPGHGNTSVCLPIQTPIRKYGALWMNISDDRSQQPTNPADLQTLVNQAAIALERSLLLVESRQQAHNLKDALDKLEATYDQTLTSLMSALDARDRETEGHSARVSQLAGKLGEALGLSRQELKALERGSLLHDIGKIGISDTILHKPGPLTEGEWRIMRLHPDIGARIVEGIPFLQDTLPLIRYHQERWDGSGYPIGLSGENIPLIARLFSVVDAFDALTSNRPYRNKSSRDETLMYLREQAGVLFDPRIVEAFEKLVLQGQAEDLLEYG